LVFAPGYEAHDSTEEAPNPIGNRVRVRVRVRVGIRVGIRVRATARVRVWVGAKVRVRVSHDLENRNISPLKVDRVLK
jgi:hypothetical protein